eukprot:11184103-Lingulodinium_polyedra.AAC.1
MSGMRSLASGLAKWRSNSPPMVSCPVARPLGDPAKTPVSCSSVVYCCGEERVSCVGGPWFAP